jgi:hypothetical protein
VETIKHNQQNTAGCGESLQTALGEAVGLQLTILVRTDQVLLLLDITVQNGEVEIRRGLVQVLVSVVGLENVCRDGSLATGPGYHQIRKTYHE